MNVRERFLKTVRGETADRVPLMGYGLAVGSREEIAKVKDPRRRELVKRAFPHTHAQWGVSTHGNRYLMTPPQRMKEIDRQETAEGVTATTQIDTPKGSLTAVTTTNALTKTVWTTKYPCESLEDIEKIRSIPWERPEGLTPPNMSRRPNDFDERYIVHSGVSSPFVCVGGMMTYQYFLELCATERELLKELTAECEQRVLDTLDVVLSEGTVEYVWIGGCEWVTPPMASAEVYEELVQGPESRVIERIHAGGALSHVHCHGNVRSTLELAIERGADLFEPVEPPPDGDVTMAEAKAIVAGRMTLAGNIEARVLAFGDDDEIDAACRAAFDGGKERFVLATTAGFEGEVTDRMCRNYHRMLDIWEELSPI